VVVAEWSGRYQEGGETEGQRRAVTVGGAERRGEVSRRRRRRTDGGGQTCPSRFGAVERREMTSGARLSAR
jgi:hypothetical protein